MKNKPFAAGFLVLALLCVSTAYGASTWEGSAVVSSTSDFSGEGLFGACNSFPLNSSVEVENLETGRKISVLITKNVDNPAIFMVLSPKAGSDLGMKAGSSARIRVLAPSGAASTPAPSSASKATESTDPDYNPRLLASIKPVPTAPAGSESSKDFLSLLGAGYPGASTPEVPQTSDQTLPSDSPGPSLAPADSGTEPPAIEAVAPGKALLPKLPENVAQGLPPPASSSPNPALAAPSVLNPEAPATSSLNPPASRSLPGGELALPTPASAVPLDSSPPQVSEPRAAPAAEAPVSLPSLPEALAQAEPEPVVTPVIETQPIEAPPMEPALLSVLDFEAPPALAEKPQLVLAEPLIPTEDGTAEAVQAPSLSEASAKAPSGAQPSLGLPEPGLGPDILPEAILERLVNPPPSKPNLALADSEVILPATDKPETLAIEGTKPGPGDKMIALVPTEPRPPEKPEALGPQASPAKAPEPSKPALASPSSAATVAPVTPQAGSPKAPAVTAAPATAAPPATVAPPVKPTTTTPQAAKPVATLAAPPAIPAGAPAKEPADLVRLTGMKPGSWYVQIGLFGTEEALRNAIKTTAKKFPVLYETVLDAKGVARYRLYVGPLGRDEGGLVLTRIKGLGYKDAILKKG